MALEIPTTPFYPFNVVLAVADAVQSIAPHTSGTNPDTGLPYRDGLRVERRRLLDSDASETVGVFPTVWDPDDNSVEMRGLPVPIATVQRYPILIQSWVVEGDEMVAIRTHSYLSTRIRLELQTNADLFMALRTPAMTVELPGGMKESVLRWGVEAQSHLSARRESAFGYLSTTEFWVDTQIS